MSQNGWFKCYRSTEADELQRRHPNAFLLLCQIARRARWKDCAITKLKAGEAFIGDWAEAGLRSEMVYRVAKKVLLDARLATFRTTNKGTIATLPNSTIFGGFEDDNNEQDNRPVTDKQQASNEPTTSNKKERRIDGKNPLSDDMEILWKIAPAKAKDRSSKAQVEKALKAVPSQKRKPIEEIAESLRQWCLCDDWTKDGGQFVPGLHIWIKDLKWESTPSTQGRALDHPEFVSLFPGHRPPKA